MYNKTTKLLLASAISTACCNLQAAESTDEQIIVTANRYTQTVSDSMASVTVIDRDEIEKSSAKDLPALLNRVAGFDIKVSGPYGKLSSVFMRGTNSNHILVLVDGVKLYSATAGSTAFQYLPLNQIERIEIVRGPRSSVYGSEAIGGVIQIFTRNYEVQQNAMTDIGYGSHGEKLISANLAGSTDKARFSLSASHNSSDGIDSIRHNSTNDDDAYSNDSVSARFNYAFNSAIALESAFLNTQGVTDYDNCFNTLTFATSDACESHFTQQTFSNILKFTPDSIWDGQMTIGSSRDIDDNLWESSPNYRYETQRTDIAFTNNYQVTEKHLASFGFDYAEDTVTTTAYAPGTPSSRDNVAVFASWNADYDLIDVNLSVRRDDNEQFGKHNTGSLALGHTLTNNIRITLSHATAFKAPAFNDLYFPFYGNTDLEPEESSSTELGISGKQDSYSWSFNVYQTDVDNLIAYDPNIFIANNINKAEITGAELIAGFKLVDWQFDMNASYVDAVNKSDTNDGKQLVFRAKESFNLKAYRDFGNFGFGASVLAQGKRYTSSDNSTSLPGYGVVDANMDYAINKQVTITAKLHNIADKEYAINADLFNGIYSTLGRTFFVNLSYSM